MPAISKSLGQWLRSGLDFIAPQTCIGCNCLIDESRIGEDERLCCSCREQLFPLPENYCEKCGAPLGPHIDSQNGCFHCKNDSFAFESVIALDAHSGLLRDLSIRAKKSIDAAGTRYLCSVLCSKNQTKLLDWEIDTIVPVPSHWSDRMKMRNLAPEEIAQQAGRSLRVPVSRNILQKHRRTAKQTSLTPTERRKNLRGVFKVKGKPRLSGLNILIVDDILTTGSTCHEVAKTLRKAGANRVYVAVIARGVGAV